MESWQEIGKQRLLVEGDILRWNVRGVISGFELTSIFEEGYRVQTTHGHALFCIHIIGDWEFPSETRQALAQFHRTHKAVGATAIVGLNAKTAMFINVVLRGVAKVSGHRPKTRFCDAVPEAIAWLGEQRALFRARS